MSLWVKWLYGCVCDSACLWVCAYRYTCVLCTDDYTCSFAVEQSSPCFHIFTRWFRGLFSVQAILLVHLFFTVCALIMQWWQAFLLLENRSFLIFFIWTSKVRICVVMSWSAAYFCFRVARKFSNKHYAQTVEPNVFILAMIIDGQAWELAADPRISVGKKNVRPQK